MTTSPQLRMRTTIALALALVAGCDDDGSGFTGDYETIEISAGACDAPGAAQPIDDDSRWFQLADVTTPSGVLVGYFPCTGPAMCLADHDLYRSFGRDGERWLTTVAFAHEPGCTLRYRERTLHRDDSATIRIEDLAYEEIDPALTGAACAIAEARRRGTAMPCVQRTVLRAETRAY